MKIIGLTYFEGTYRMAMKSDSSLLQGQQPFFLPDWSRQIVAVPCLATRITRMGRHISEKFVSRYFQEKATALNFRADDYLHLNRWTEGMAFDQAFALGEWVDADSFEAETTPTDISLEQAIVRISEVMTLRTGDIIFVDNGQPQPVQTGQEYTLYINKTDSNGNREKRENLYCRIK